MKKRGTTDFQARVYAAVRRIPRGKVVSYASIATAVGCGSPRAVGQAMRLCEEDGVPCHRVVAAGCLLGGYGGKAAGNPVQKKKRRLLAEGVRFDRQGRIDPACVLRDSPRLHWLLGGNRSKA